MFFKNNLLDSLIDDYNDLFDRPKEIERTDNIVKYTIDVPGFNEKNLNIEVVDGTLTIKGETENRKFFKQYYSNDINIDDIEATIKDGVLTLSLKIQKVEPKQISIKPQVPQIE